MRASGIIKICSLLLMGLIFSSVNGAEPEQKTLTPDLRDELQIDIVSEQPSKEQQELLVSLRNHLKNQYNLDLKARHIYWRKQSDWKNQLKDSPSKLVLTLGDISWHKVSQLALDKQQLGLFLSNSNLMELRKKHQSNQFGISHEQSIERFFYLIRALSPRFSKVAAIFPNQNGLESIETKKLSQALRLRFKPLLYKNNLEKIRLVKDLEVCCNILIYPSEHPLIDAFERKSILLNSYRNRILVIGNSVKTLKEGAMLALFTPANQVAQQAANMIGTKLIQAGSLIPSQRFQFPQEFTLDSNQQIEQIFGYNDLSLGRLANKIKILEQQQAQGNTHE